MSAVSVSSLLSEVYALTGRPDRSAEALLALRRTFFLLHRKAKFWKDLRIEWKSSQAPSDSRSLATQVVDLSTITNLRQVYMVRSEGCKPLDPIDVSDQLDPDDLYRPNVWWAVGNELQLRASEGISSWEIHYFRLPPWDNTTMDDWLIDEHQDLLVLKTAQEILQLIGDTELAASYAASVQPLMADLLQDNIEAFAR